jgi:hypothetical protein
MARDYDNSNRETTKEKRVSFRLTEEQFADFQEIVSAVGLSKTDTFLHILDTHMYAAKIIRDSK